MALRKSQISYVDYHWQPIRGCTPCSECCKYCWSHSLNRNRQKNKSIKTRTFDDVYIDDKEMSARLTTPGFAESRRPRCFVCSQSDLFHKYVSDSTITQIFDKMIKYTDVDFLVLTKRTPRLAKLGQKLPWADNIWCGVTVESGKYISRIADLQKVPAKIRWVSFEPILSDFPKMDLSNIHWAAIGGLHLKNDNEKGIDADDVFAKYDFANRFDGWVDGLMTQCVKQGVAVYLKQTWGRTPMPHPEWQGRQWVQFPVNALPYESVDLFNINTSEPKTTGDAMSNKKSVAKTMKTEIVVDEFDTLIEKLPAEKQKRVREIDKVMQLHNSNIFEIGRQMAELQQIIYSKTQHGQKQDEFFNLVKNRYAIERSYARNIMDAAEVHDYFEANGCNILPQNDLQCRAIRWTAKRLHNSTDLDKCLDVWEEFLNGNIGINKAEITAKKIKAIAPAPVTTARPMTISRIQSFTSLLTDDVFDDIDDDDKDNALAAIDDMIAKLEAIKASMS